MGLRRFEDRRAYILRQEGMTQIGSSSNSTPDAVPILLSANTEVTHSLSSSVSSHPVASGNDRSDHVTVKNDKIYIRGIVSDTPMDFTLRSSQSRKEYVKILNEIKRNKEFVSVRMSEITDEGFDNCFITSIDFRKTNRVGDGLEVNLTLKKALVGFSKDIVKIPKEAKKDSVAETTEAGGTTTTISDAPIEVSNMSKILDTYTSDLLDSVL